MNIFEDFKFNYRVIDKEYFLDELFKNSYFEYKEILKESGIAKKPL